MWNLSFYTNTLFPFYKQDTGRCVGIQGHASTVALTRLESILQGGCYVQLMEGMPVSSWEERQRFALGSLVRFRSFVPVSVQNQVTQR